jgi:hypothetical protein
MHYQPPGVWTYMSDMGSLGDIRWSARDVRFSNWPVGVKRFQAIHDCGVGIARGLVLLFGLGTKALPSWDSRTRWNNLYRGLAVAVGRSKRTCELTSSVVPRGTSFHRLAELEFPPIALDPERPHTATESLTKQVCNGLLQQNLPISDLIHATAFEANRTLPSE